MRDGITISVALGEIPGVATVRLSNQSDPFVVDVLGADHDDAGNVCRLYLGQLIHRDDRYCGWTASGAISTILTRCEASL